MALYVGREQETEALLQLRRKRTSSLVVCHGRRRVGKSTFIRESARRLDHLLAFEGLPPRPGLTRADQLEAFSEQLARQARLPRLTLESWPQALQLLESAIPTSGWTVLLLDEISWMAIGDPDFAGHLKAVWDTSLSRRARLILVLCGSVSSWIDQNILNSAGFVGRCSLAIHLRPLPLPSCNAFWRGKGASAAEKLRLLSVTGGIPRYLEEIDPSASAASNVQRLCFEPGGLLFREFNQIFHDIFHRRAATYRDIVTTLRDGRRSVSEISKALRQQRGGTLTSAVSDLEQAGFISRDVAFDPSTAEDRPRVIRYRLSDNYLRFYLKYVTPHVTNIKKGLYRLGPLESLTAWDTIMGLQFENLVLENLEQVRGKLGLARAVVLNEGPYFQTKTARRQACQIDALIRTKSSIWVVESKLRKSIDVGVITEVRRKVERLKPPSALSVRTVLIYEGDLDPRVEEEDYFDAIIPFGDLLRA